MAEEEMKMIGVKESTWELINNYQEELQKKFDKSLSLEKIIKLLLQERDDKKIKERLEKIKEVDL